MEILKVEIAQNCTFHHCRLHDSTFRTGNGLRTATSTICFSSFFSAVCKEPFVLLKPLPGIRT